MVKLSGLFIFGVVCSLAIWLQPRFRVQAEAPANNRPPLVEAILTEGPSWRNYRYLYIRVFADGTVEFHDPLDVDLTKPIPVIKKLAKADDIAALQALLHSREVQGLSGSFERENEGQSRETLDVEIHLNSTVQELKLVNFHSTDFKDGRPPYPIAAIRLGCMIDKFEKTAKESDWQMEDCKKLPKPN